MLKKVSDIIIEILEKNGPMRSSTIKTILQKEGLLDRSSRSDEALRQQLSRIEGKVKKLNCLPLPKKESFFYLSGQEQKYIYWKNLVQAIVETHSSIGVAMQSIISRNNGIPANIFDIVSGSPALTLHKKVKSKEILKTLLDVNLIKKESILEKDSYYVVDAFGQLGNYDLKKIDLNNIIEETTIEIVYEWARKTGLASFKKIRKRGDQNPPEFGKYYWDITAPSFIYPITINRSNRKNGYIVIDVVNEDIDLNGAQYLINKCETIRAIKKMPSFLPILIANRFEPNAFKLGKEKGLLFTTPEILFGKEVKEILKSLSDNLLNASKLIENKALDIDGLTKKLTRLEGYSHNLRGKLFELIIGIIIADGDGNIEFGEIFINSSSERAEADIVHTKGNHSVNIYECKCNKNNLIDEKVVKAWLHKKIPVIYASMIQDKRYSKRKNFTFEIWTNSGFTEEALKYFIAFQNKTQKYKIALSDKKAIMAFAKEKQNSAMVKNLEQFFIND